MVSITCRTEYLTGRHHNSAAAAGLLTVTALVALVGLRVVGVGGMTTAAVVAGLLGCSMAIAAHGRLGRRGAVLLTVDDETVYFGDERRELVSYPLESLRSFAVGGPADVTSASTGRSHHLTVFGQKYLALTFARDVPKVGSHVDDDLDTDRWRVAIVEGDPAVTAIVDRLRAHAPERVSTRKQAAAADVARSTVSVSVGSAPEPEDDGPLPGGEPDVDLRRPRIADAGTEEAARRLWEESVRRHDEILRAYAGYELDSAMLLRYPAVTDVTVEQTQDFHHALDEAGALRTDAYPGDRGIADAYQQSVRRLRRAWIACEKHGRRVGTGYLDPADRNSLDTALKLYNHAAASSTPTEQASYYGRVRDIVSTMTDRGVLHPPQAALSELENVTRRALEAGPA
ncbi:hypothetical protein GP2_021_00240 [Gordonia paraffinivorans NBRC 108238]|uniref:Uncharacterized protein n=1 Tax=Gordonia paraffinivorans NBRC 108238 TaxID=1223543 RepID=A0ABQ0IMW5_9ACTN|nr:hypothetical protein [Gordonia paraffinivorans]GAC84306.1 hypothetical protein GP2_021_00240 [Gordonia paraffinivorans NBRC 108238]